MKISLDWLNQYLDPPLPADPDAVDELLTGQGFPVEETVALDGGDFMFDVEVTSNRGDCLSHVGLAREAAAGTGGTLKPPAIELPEAGDTDVQAAASVELRGGALPGCPLYTARVITGLQVGPSPDWLVARLEAVGLRSVNNVVDVTNFVLHELGQPLHAFDLGRLAGRKVVVRHAEKGEPFAAIDGTKHELRADMLVIADGQRPQAVAGVMGGAESEVSDTTTDVLLESAVFDPLSVRTTSRALKLASDSSFRFERGVDPAGVERASTRAAALIVELAGGTLTEGVIRAGALPEEPTRLVLRAERCRKLLGVEIDTAAQAELLGRLGFGCEINGDELTVTVPSHRLDITREVDLIEEVARMHGLDVIPVSPKLSLTARPPQAAVSARRRLAAALVGRGYHEAVTFSFIRPELGEPFLPPEAGQLRLGGDHKKDEPMLRPSLLPSLLRCRKVNQDAGNTGVRLFETASTWRVVDGAAVEKVRLALLADPEQAGPKGHDAAVRSLRGAIDEAVETLGGAAARAQLAVKPCEQSDVFAAAGEVLLGGEHLGVIGLIAPATRKKFDLKSDAVAAELDLPALLRLYPAEPAVAPPPRFPAIERDLSVVVEDAATWSDVAAAVAAVSPDRLEAVEYLGLYRGQPIPAGRKSVSLRLRFRDAARTLRHDEVDPQVGAVIAALQERLGAELRA
ncbi:MAG: phenylalanine--tRNA ligase subunit beta [Planctomycetota bacterium]